jgi:hypothetical protein
MVVGTNNDPASSSSSPDDRRLLFNASELPVVQYQYQRDGRYWRYVLLILILFRYLRRTTQHILFFRYCMVGTIYYIMIPYTFEAEVREGEAHGSAHEDRG